jgi:hypothetical protein
MTIFKRHINSTISLIVYALLWIYFLYRFTLGKPVSFHSDIVANGQFILITLLVFIIYFITFTFLTLTNTKQKQKDFLIFLGFVLTPVSFLTIYLLFNL